MCVCDIITFVFIFITPLSWLPSPKESFVVAVIATGTTLIGFTLIGFYAFSNPDLDPVTNERTATPKIFDFPGLSEDSVGFTQRTLPSGQKLSSVISLFILYMY